MTCHGSFTVNDGTYEYKYRCELPEHGSSTMHSCNKHTISGTCSYNINTRCTQSNKGVEWRCDGGMLVVQPKMTKFGKPYTFCGAADIGGAYVAKHCGGMRVPADEMAAAAAAVASAHTAAGSGMTRSVDEVEIVMPTDYMVFRMNAKQFNAMRSELFARPLAGIKEPASSTPTHGDSTLAGMGIPIARFETFDLIWQ